MSDTSEVNRPLAHAWILLCLALGLHVFDEATTGFLGIYNPTVIALRERFGWWPMPTFEFGEWLAGLLVGCVVLLALTGLVARGVTGTRALAYGFAIGQGTRARHSTRHQPSESEQDHAAHQ